MADIFSKKKRSEIMRAVKSKGSKIELFARKILREKGLRFKKNVRGLPGTPDIVLMDKKLVIFLDSCFWHGCRWHGTIPASNKVFWSNKILQNKIRDKKVNRELKKIGWKVKRIWEHNLDLEILRFVSINNKRID